MIGKRVFVYYNFHKKLFSVRDYMTGLVIAHVVKIAIKDAIFKVSEAGRQRVLLNKRKNIHAGVIGIVRNVPAKSIRNSAYYNPYKNDSFVGANGEKIKTAKIVLLHSINGYANVVYEPN